MPGNFIFLTGLPGVGKSYWGKRWASICNWEHLDLDTEIERLEKCSIPEFISLQGLAQFRENELLVIQKVVEENSGNWIISTGGGTVSYKPSLHFMKESGCIVLLRAPLVAITKNLEQEPGKRPLFNINKDILSQLQSFWDQRKAAYNQAHLTLQLSTTPEKLIHQILASCTHQH